MFGYVTIAPGLDEEGRKRYRACYCGLCRTLKRRYGQLGRMTLSYDMTFLYMLLGSLYEPDERAGRERCPPHPFKPHEYAESELSDYCADINIALSYHKLMDDWRDERDPARWLEARALRKAYAQVSARYPAQCAQIERCLSELSSLEKSGRDDLDALVNLTGQLLGAAYRYRNDEWTDALVRMGEGLGRFVYLMDAYDDLPADKRRHRYNPLASYEGREDYEAFVKRSLTLLIAECTEAFEELPLVKDMDILRNILYAGCWSRYQLIQSRRDRKKGKLEPKEDGA